MQRRILVPLDGSKAAEGVLGHLGHLARGSDVRITLLRVIEPAARAEIIDTEHELPRFRTEKVDVARSHLEQVRRRLRADGLDAEVLLMRGVAIDSICQAREHVDADLLAMTSRGRSSVAGALFGNVMLGVLNRGPCPIFIAPTEYERPTTGFRRVLLPLDGSSRAESVLPLAQALAQAHGASMYLLRVVRTGYQTMALEDVDRELEGNSGKGLLSRLGQQQDTERLREAQAYLRATRADLQAHGLEVEAHLGRGRPTECILELADDVDVDLVALTNHLRSGLASVLYGSVASGLLGRLPRPMLIVPTGDPPPRNFA
jgi:nucleotide-binding universal stress UspA family protein